MAHGQRRACGYRKVGGLYLCADGPGDPCHRLPILLEVCPTCHGGIKQTRGWTWINPDLLDGNCNNYSTTDRSVIHCALCPACTPTLLGQKAGLIWIGERFYKTPADFTCEAIEMGVSRRVTAIPKGFKVGEHFVLVAHPKAVKVACACFLPRQDNALISCENCDGSGYQYKPGIFHVFKPSRIEKILADDATPEEIKEWTDRGCKVVKLPRNDRDHQGTVYDDEETAELPAAQPKKRPAQAPAAVLEERWSNLSPDQGTEECICMLCAKMIGLHDCDPAWDYHDPECIGCSICEIAVRIFNGEQEMRFHPRCFEQATKKQIAKLSAEIQSQKRQ